MSDKYLRDDRHHLINAIGTELAWGWSPAVDFVSLLSQRKKCLIAGGAAVPNTSHGNGPTASEDSATATSCPRAVESDPTDVDAMIAAIRQRAEKEKEKKEKEEKEEEEEDSDSVRILLCGACDIRHIFRTLSSLRVASASAKQPLYHFYIYEPNLRIHCRHLFFLQWLIDSMFSLDELEERVLMFLDVFGNATTRDATAAHIRSVSQRLQRMLRKDEGALSALVSFAEMKSKERDFVEEQLDHWTRDASVAKITESWSKRVQQEMAERYDNRDNIIDWDFNFHLLDYTNLIKFPEYRTWRNSGIAFDATHINPRRGFSYEYKVPNKTLCHFNRRGDGAFVGDVKNGPFFAFGAQTANAHIRARTVDGTCKYGNGVVSMHNTRAWLYALLTGLEWPWSDHAFAWDDEANYNYLPPGTPSTTTHRAAFPNVRFHFIGLDLARFIQRAQVQPKLRFDAAFVGVNCTQFMTAEFLHTLMKGDAVVVTETAKFVVDARDEAKVAFIEKIRDLAHAAGWEEDKDLTSTLHKDQPELPMDSLASRAKKQTRERYAMPYQLVITSQETCAAAAGAN